MSWITIATYLLLAPFNKLVLDCISRMFNEKGSGWHIAIPLAIIGTVLELGRMLILQEEGVLYITSGLNYIAYHLAALLLIKGVYEPGLFKTLTLWIIFSIAEVFMYVLLSVLMIYFFIL
ncbi:MAG: hypothetical protein U9M95_01830 [Candidatus Altiarchaeota archaeon]|nr:hypothetical protein [Candidatus Altiarchaeota archaeon]